MDAWASWGGKRGRWVETDDTEYPIALVDDVEHKRWKVGTDDEHPGRIFLWDGAVYYQGRH